MSFRNLALIGWLAGICAFLVGAPAATFATLSPWLWLVAACGVTFPVAAAVRPTLLSREELKSRGAVGLAILGASATITSSFQVVDAETAVSVAARMPTIIMTGLTTLGVGAVLMLPIRAIPGAKKFQDMMSIPELRKKLFMTFALLVVYRIGFYITLPGVNAAAVERMTEQGQMGGLGSLLSFAGAITGGALRQCVVFALGVMPYISASIIFSLLVKVVPALEALQKEGATGRQKINQYTRYTTVGLCLFQALVITSWMTSQGQGVEAIVQPSVATTWWWIQTVVALTTGGIFLMWVGEKITEFGVGNGLSLLIMAGIIARMPTAFGQFTMDIVNMAGTAGRAATTQHALKLVAILVIFVGVVFACTIMHVSQRRIPIQHAKHQRGRKVYGGQRHYLPLKVNAGGVMPVIFAQSLLILPAALFSMFPSTQAWADVFYRQEGWWYYVLTIVLVAFFTYFWISLMFNPVEMASNMKEYGSFIPGIRPGRNTAQYLEAVMNRMTFVGASFLAAITLLPLIVAGALGVQFYLTSFLGGTGILIIVSVCLDLVQKVESHLLMRHYEGFMKGGKKGSGGRGRL